MENRTKGTDLAQVNVEAIMEHIKVEAASRRGVNETNSPSPPRADDQQTFPEVPLLSLEPIHTTPAFEPKSEGYRLGDFLIFYDHEFVTHAYRGILERPPDDFGYHYYLDRLREGNLNRVEVLGRLRYAPEGRSRKVRVKWLLPYFIVLSFLRIPVLGYLGRLAAGLLRLPALIRNLQNLDSFTHAQLLSLKEHVNLDARQVQAVVNDLAKSSSSAVETLANDLTKNSSAAMQTLANVEILVARLDSELARKVEIDQVDLLQRLKADRDMVAEKTELAHIEKLIENLGLELKSKPGRDVVVEKASWRISKIS